MEMKQYKFLRLLYLFMTVLENNSAFIKECDHNHYKVDFNNIGQDVENFWYSTGEI